MATLTDRQALVLRTFELNPDLSVSEVAKQHGLKTHTVRRELQFLKEMNLIKPVVIINPATFGYQMYEFLIATNLESSEDRKNFSKDIVNSGRVCIFVDIGGEFEYLFTILAKSPLEVFDLIAKLEKKYGMFLKDRCLSQSLSFYGFGRKYLTPNFKTGIYVEPRVSDVQITLDELDHNILFELNKGADVSSAAMARSLGIKPSTYDYRLKRLKTSGVITRLVYATNSAPIGKLEFMVAGAFKTMNKAHRSSFIDFCKEHLRIVNLTILFGEWDFRLTVETETQSEVPEIIHELKEQFKDVLQKIRVIPMLRFHNLNTYPFMDPPN